MSRTTLSVCISEVCALWETFGRHRIQILKRTEEEREREREKKIRPVRWVCRKKEVHLSVTIRLPPPRLPADLPELRSGSSIAQRLLSTLPEPPMMDSCRKSGPGSEIIYSRAR